MAVTFGLLWLMAHEYAQDPDFDSWILNWLGVAVALVLPLGTGYGIGRYWAVVLIVWVAFAGGLAEDLEPLRPSQSGEAELGGYEGTVVFTSLLFAAAHTVLIPLGCLLRKHRLRDLFPHRGNWPP